ncbi:hypothetical protein BESB_082230 [Besnoitia besnoiti]|uniref:Uncharacterized protein n=1 Tax=Besnoitia besnoiti TaxID=94643 RepID=A0A2A9M755_BESBE|nr:hypothetical protein BESB_082230 [Besnoitia besnoiti]PFH33024.1 hypothetical protein BESB_082230 [Besnoitia besnoiti]
MTALPDNATAPVGILPQQPCRAAPSPGLPVSPLPRRVEPLPAASSELARASARPLLAAAAPARPEANPRGCADREAGAKALPSAFRGAAPDPSLDAAPSELPTLATAASLLSTQGEEKGAAARPSVSCAAAASPVRGAGAARGDAGRDARRGRQTDAPAASAQPCGAPAAAFAPAASLQGAGGPQATIPCAGHFTSAAVDGASPGVGGEDGGEDGLVQRFLSLSKNLVFRRRVLTPDERPSSRFDGNAYYTWVGATHLPHHEGARRTESSLGSHPSGPAPFFLASAPSPSCGGAAPPPVCATSPAAGAAPVAPSGTPRSLRTPAVAAARLAASQPRDKSTQSAASAGPRQFLERRSGETGSVGAPVRIRHLIELRASDRAAGAARRLCVNGEGDIPATLKAQVVQHIPGRIAVWVRQSRRFEAPRRVPQSAATGSQGVEACSLPSCVITYVLRADVCGAAGAAVRRGSGLESVALARRRRRGVRAADAVVGFQRQPRGVPAHDAVSVLRQGGPVCRAPPDYYRPLISCCFENTATPRVPASFLPLEAQRLLVEATARSPSPAAARLCNEAFPLLAATLPRTLFFDPPNAAALFPFRAKPLAGDAQTAPQRLPCGGAARGRAGSDAERDRLEAALRAKEAGDRCRQQGDDEAAPAQQDSATLARRTMSLVAERLGDTDARRREAPARRRRQSSDAYCPTHLFETSPARRTDWHPPFLDSRALEPEPSKTSSPSRRVEYYFLAASAAARRRRAGVKAAQGSRTRAGTGPAVRDREAAGDQRAAELDDSLNLADSAEEEEEVPSRSSSSFSLSSRLVSRESLGGEALERLFSHECLAATGKEPQPRHYSAFVQCRRATCEIYSMEDEASSDGVSLSSRAPTARTAQGEEAAQRRDGDAATTAEVTREKSGDERGVSSGRALCPTLPLQDNAVEEWLLISGASLPPLALAKLVAPDRPPPTGLAGDCPEVGEETPAAAQHPAGDAGRAFDSPRDSALANGDAEAEEDAQPDSERRRTVSARAMHAGKEQAGSVEPRRAASAQAEPQGDSGRAEDAEERKQTSRVKEMALKWDRAAASIQYSRGSLSLASPRTRPGHERAASADYSEDGASALYARYGNVAERYLQHLKRTGGASEETHSAPPAPQAPGRRPASPAEASSAPAEVPLRASRREGGGDARAADAPQDGAGAAEYEAA